MIDHRIETFLCLCETLSYTKCANELHITQPAVTQHIKFLEDYYKVKLFSYQSKQLKLTSEGEKLRKYLKSLEVSSRHIKELIRSNSTDYLSFKIGVTKSIAQDIISNIMLAYYQLYPNQSFDVIVDNTQNLQSLLLDGKIDLAMVEGNFNHNDFEYFLYSKEAYIGVCGKQKLDEFHSYKISDLFDQTLIIREEGSGTRNILENELLKTHINIKSFSQVLVMNDFSLIKNFLINNVGISFMFETVVRQELSNGSLSKININDFEIIREFNVIYCKDNLRISQLTLLIDFIKAFSKV